MTSPLRPGTAGRPQRTARVGGLQLTETQHRSGLVVPRHLHERASINLVLRGVYQESFPGSRGDYEPMSLVFKPAGEPHSNHFAESGATCLLVEVDAEEQAALGSHASVLHRAGHTRAPALAGIALRLHRELLLGDADSPLVMHGLALELIGLASRAMRGARGEPPRGLKRAIAFLKDFFCEPITIAQVAAAANLHPAHLARLFRRHEGCSIGEYVRRLRVARVAERLLASRESLAQIAASTGFADQSHMTRTFRRHYGFTPARFRSP